MAKAARRGGRVKPLVGEDEGTQEEKRKAAARAGRPKKKQVDEDDPKDSLDEIMAEQKKKRGRPKKVTPSNKGTPAEVKKSSKQEADTKEVVARKGKLRVQDKDDKSRAVDRKPSAQAKEEPSPQSTRRRKGEAIAQPKTESDEAPETDSKKKQDTEKGPEGQAEQSKQQNEVVKINRAPVLTLWVAVVAQREGYSFEEAVTFGKAISGLYAHSKGKRLGLVEEPDEEREEEKKRMKEGKQKFEAFGTKILGEKSDGLRLAVQEGKAIKPASVQAYLHRAFKDKFVQVKEAMEVLAEAHSADSIGGLGYQLYENFRPNIPEGTRGWGSKGDLDLQYIRQLAKDA
eukprot:SM000001S04449  [mRNA]  locus=s1:273364:275578:- [translate_table: standard]